MKWREWLQFSARERMGVLALIVLIVLVYSIPWWMNWVRKDALNEGEEWQQLLALVETQQKTNHKEYKQTFRVIDQKEKPYTGNTYPKNENNASSDANSHYSQEKNSRPAPPNVEPVYSKLPPGSKIDINLADAALFEKLPGIGPVLSKRIVAYRNAIGGFRNVEQVGKTYGIADSVFQKILPMLENRHPPPPPRIHINTASEKELGNHPLISWPLAKQIVAYREAHGPFDTTEDLLRLLEVDSVLMNTLSPLLEFNVKNPEKH